MTVRLISSFCDNFVVLRRFALLGVICLDDAAISDFSAIIGEMKSMIDSIVG